jgi:uncharacterized CHY-type Zn-finger protein
VYINRYTKCYHYHVKEFVLSIFFDPIQIEFFFCVELHRNETIPGMVEGDEFKYDIFDIL